ncbi:DNA-binding transcriptional regulator [Microbacterium sp. X-17]|uniref:AraC family transcriptional regulator n=1 Tax=Microbacterium sp. X-17 TaxID=3144404 RepID=UPI0031F4C84C
MPAMRERQVALLIETSNAYARGLLGGIRRYLIDHPGWSIYLGEHSRQDTDLSWLEGWRGDGIIARIENRQIADQVRRLDLPAVDLSAARLLPELPCVETDDEQIARGAVDHLASRGLRHFAYCGDERFAWSIKRREWFRLCLAERGVVAHEYDLAPSGTIADDRAALARWVADLPKPIGILACYDIAGQSVLEACAIAGVDVPDEVAVLGVDNDDLICNLTSPPLSSIQSDASRTGYFAASLLDEMMAGAPVPGELHLVPPMGIVTRQSTDILAVDDPVVVRALRFIRERAEQPVSVSLVERHAGLARRALDIRFLKLIGHTVHSEITQVRMERLAQLLAETDATLPQLAERLGFPHAEYMGVAFKRYTGRAPGEYRRAARGGPTE